MTEKQGADIPESHFEYVAQFDRPMFGAWTVPNKCIEALYPKLQSYDVGLGDITWNRQSSSAKELQFIVNVTKLRATLRLGLDSVIFSVSNPDWSEAPALTELFGQSLATIREAGSVNVTSQEVALVMHVRAGKVPFSEVMASLVDSGRLGKAQMYGIVAYNEGHTFLLDKSVRYPDSLFIRLHRVFPPSVDFGNMAVALYEDESRALGIFGLEELMK